jgi:hypothetical protein
MSKRKRATGSKHARGAPVAKAQRAAQAIVRSPKDSRPRSAEAGVIELSPKRPHETQQEALHVEETLHVENPVTALEDVCKQTAADTDSKEWTNFFSATASMRAYQAKLTEMAQANMRSAFEFAQRLATIRSPIEFPIVIAEFTSKRIAMFGNYFKEMAELNTKRWTA